MVRAIGPIAPRNENGPIFGGKCPTDGIRPAVGFSEQMPQKCAGSRTEPPSFSDARKTRFGCAAYSLLMLWLLRHAEAADGAPDDERPLTEKGMRQADAAGIALARLGVHLDLCLSSPKLRALQTAQRACEPLGVDIRVERALQFSAHHIFRARAGIVSNGFRFNNARATKRSRQYGKF